jgi:hypothetical protein
MRPLLIVAVAQLLAAPVMAASEFEVQSAQGASALKVGDRLPAGALVDLPSGALVGLVERGSGGLRQRVCAGPYRGPIDACPKPRAASQRPYVPGGSRSIAQPPADRR